MRLLIVISFIFLFAKCSIYQDNKNNVLLGEWFLPQTNYQVIVKKESIKLLGSDTSVYKYSYEAKDSILSIFIPNSKNTYKHTAKMKLIKWSVNKDTLTFLDDYQGKMHIAYRRLK